MSELSSLVRRQLGWALGFSLAINLALLTPSIFMLQVYDRVLVTRSVETLVMLLVLALGTLAVYGALEQTRSRLLTVQGMAMERQLGPAILRTMMLSQARQLPGPAAEGLRDLATLRTFLAGPAMQAVFDAPWAVVYMLLIAAFDWRLGLMAVMAALCLLGLTAWNHRIVRAGLPAVQQSARAASQLAERGLHNAEVVTALGMIKALADRWSGRTTASQEASLAASAGSGALTAVSRSFRQMIQVLMLSLGAWLVIREGATPGVMIATTIILGRALAPVEQLIGGWQGLAEARAAHQRLAQLLAAAEKDLPLTQLPAPKGHLQAESLGYAAPGGRVLLRGVQLQALPGQVLVVVGGSGAGKTTLVRLLVGVLRATQGAVRIDGADIRHYEPVLLGCALGYLPQDVELFDGTVADNIARFNEGDSEGVLLAAQDAGAHEFIVRLPQGYDTPVGMAGRLLSGGQRQRVALARALYGRPSLVILDEPDASLDGEGESALVSAIEAVRARGAAVVVVTQRRRLLSLADQVVVLREGMMETLAPGADATAARVVEVHRHVDTQERKA